MVGILRGILNSSGFVTKSVSYFTDHDEEKDRSLYPRTDFEIVFTSEVQ
jgi:hypothetical protein